MTVRVIVTGGTIDKQYDPLTGDLVFGASHVSEMLAISRHADEIAVEEIFLKDSLAMTDDDRLLVARACERAAERRIVVTHGTDTMTHTAEALATGEPLPGKTIVLTGAMVPYSFGRYSDALFNLGAALAFSATLPAGVYVAMNGLAHASGNVRKDRARGVFVAH